ncbi:putative AAA+ superfamily ATPase [Parabacteroides sp. PF5-5]|uniref:ATP-binding protein n=1 Tax=unclassified Parabacteroides TaxID=2649774 RepID=UPI002475540E|nr:MULTISPECIES: ATP-binding protein [unclassified Parabacteroides]MDH6306836.1 putative AAA+ superfamily ATPase [Parabacteroides sp. PH5-39]MDH6316282.1 putative AAA+ superfamily ATPase [Parabacteroides sp. PF5-13]MDH6319765.1 putative AAA+ superfamily ATPase [Parabacteroides sp. PH5-13]MDH6323644.1 putative AAA+ superfamily ATPase [Parabacteroides sp. PH5-8]MDH6327469.1 putative AAA+ superfamily ATPase [Parabacteroides sp. PH5-41]
MDKLFEYSNRLIKETDTKFLRYMYDEINWKNRMIGLIGPRGVGKTTLVLQYIKQNLNPAETLYVTAEDFYFVDNKFVDLADTFVKHGGKYLFIDEIHKYKDWAKELKLIYDYHKDLNVVFTGSSVLDIKKGASDLSRRAVIYNMQGLSFREYLQLFHGISARTYSLEEILQHKVELPVQHPLPLFSEYLRTGYYPFALEEDFGLRLGQIINQTLENDIPMYADMNVATGRKLKQLLAIISKSAPFKPNMSKIAEMLSASRNNIADYCLYIEEAGMIAQLRDNTGGVRGLGKVDKIYLDNTNLIYSLAEDTSNIGNIRETFFLNQMRVKYDVLSSSVADFLIDDKTFEVGGKHKGQKQIKEVENGYIVKDDIESGYLNIVPLWQLGLTY